MTWLQEQDGAVSKAHVRSLPQWQGLSEHERADISGMGIELFVPLAIKDSLLGLLMVGGKLGGRRFTTEDEEYLAMMARMAATRIDSLLLLRELAQHREDMERTQRELSGAIRMARIGDLAATLAQELEAPLQAILNVTHIMAQDAIGEAVSREDVERVNTQALRGLQCGADSLGVGR